jgi:hypothetical protein
MKKIALLFGLLLATPAFAADNAVIVTPGVGVTMKSKDIGAGVQAMQPILSDASGNTLLTTAGADAVSNTLTGIPMYGRNLVFNGTTWDRWTGLVNAAQSGTWNITNISGTVSLPTGAATSALQSSAAAAKGEGATGAAVPSGAQYGGMNIGGNLTGFAGISAGADGVSNTANQLLQGAFNYFYNGTTWDRVRGTTSGGMLVNVSNTLAAVGNNADGVAAGAGAASPVVAYNYVYNGTTWDRQKPSSAVLNPCETVAQSYAPISITSATTTRIVTPSASNKTYICGLIIVTGAANNVAVVEGTGGTCGTATAGVIGGTTAANGSNFSANGGLVLQAGKTAHAQTAGTNVDLCVITSSAGPYSGGIKYVQAP